MAIVQIRSVNWLGFAELIVYSQSNANPNDLRQAQDFISQLPAACRNSRYAVAADGTVVINILCDKNDRSAGMDGTIEIKNGIVKKIR